MSVRPHRDYVVLRPMPELLEQTSTLKFSAGDMSPEQTAIVARANTVGFIPLHHLSALSASWSSNPEALTFGQVARVGEGHRAIAEDRPRVKEGDIVGYKRNRVGHDFVQFDADGKPETVQLVHEHGLVVSYPLGAAEMPVPLCNWVITRRDREGAQKALGRSTPLTDKELAEGIVTKLHEAPGAHHGTKYEKQGARVASKTRMVIERVVSTGPGRWVNAIWNQGQFGKPRKPVFVPNETAAGELIGVLSCNARARFRVHGVDYSLVPWEDVVCAFD